jgi:hypothetical protein
MLCDAFDTLDPTQLALGSQVTVTGLALDQTARVVIVDPMPCEPPEVRDWDWRGLSTVPAEADWSVEGEELKVTLPIDLVPGPHLLCVLSGPNADAETWHEGGVPFTRVEFMLGGVAFLRGDSNRDGGVNIADGIYTLQNLFADGPPILCPDAADANDDEDVNLADAVYILQNLFAEGPPIPPPYPSCSVDTTGSGLDKTGPQLIYCDDYCPEACQDPPVPCAQ